MTPTGFANHGKSKQGSIGPLQLGSHDQIVPKNNI